MKKLPPPIQLVPLSLFKTDSIKNNCFSIPRMGGQSMLFQKIL